MITCISHTSHPAIETLGWTLLVVVLLEAAANDSSEEVRAIASQALDRIHRTP